MSFRFTVPTGSPADALFDGMPSEVREMMESGFSHLATLPSESLASVASQVVRWLDPSEPAPEVGALAEMHDLDVPAMGSIMAATTLQASALFAARPPMTVATFVAKATSTGILKAEGAPAVEAFGEKHLAGHSAALHDALARANSSMQIVPSFESLDTTIDLRVAALMEQRVVTMPIVIATLRTDTEDQELLFQMTPRDVSQLLKQLEAISKRLTRSRSMTTQLAS